LFAVIDRASISGAATRRSANSVVRKPASAKSSHPSLAHILSVHPGSATCQPSRKLGRHAFDASTTAADTTDLAWNASA
jgi:hypothetical protein